MLKKLLVLMLALFAAAAFAAVDVNKATQAELESVKGIGPSISGKILAERQKGAFKDWPDLVDRVKGVGEHNAARFSTEGLTVNGSAFAGAPAKPAAAAKAATAAVPAAKAASKAAAAMPAANPAPAASAALSAEDKKAAAKKAKEEKKAAKAAAAEEAKKAKAEKKAAKEAKAAEKAASAAPAKK